MLAILEAVAHEKALLDPVAVMSEVQRLGLPTPEESVAMIRDDRDAR